MKSISGIRENIRVTMDVMAKDRANTRIELIERAFLTSPLTTSYQVPFGTKYCVARVLGAGGGCTIDAAVPSTGWYVAGGGGAYARTTFPCTAGQTLTLQVGAVSTTSSEQVSNVYHQGVLMASANGGGSSVLNNDGAGAVVASGDEVVAGNDPAGLDGNGFWYGGDAPGDSFDADSVLCAGNGVKARNDDINNAMSAARYGGGSAVYYNGSASGNILTGGGGLVVLEFYPGDPR